MVVVVRSTEDDGGGARSQTQNLTWSLALRALIRIIQKDELVCNKQVRERPTDQALNK